MSASAGSSWRHRRIACMRAMRYAVHSYHARITTGVMIRRSRSAARLSLSPSIELLALAFLVGEVGDARRKLHIV